MAGHRMRLRTCASASSQAMPSVRIDGARYRVPAQLAGATVTVRENATDFTIWQRERLVATHPRQGRHQVVMVPAP